VPGENVDVEKEKKNPVKYAGAKYYITTHWK
jgi:hypothetical protein